jgi:hypothetical protein
MTTHSLVNPHILTIHNYTILYTTPLYIMKPKWLIQHHEAIHAVFLTL